MNVLINKEYPEIIIDGRRIPFTRREFDVFIFLWEHKSRFCTRIIIHNTILGAHSFYHPRSIDAIISRIRKKIYNTSVKLETKSGFGYYFR